MVYGFRFGLIDLGKAWICETFRQLWVETVTFSLGVKRLMQMGRLWIGNGIEQWREQRVSGLTN